MHRTRWNWVAVLLLLGLLAACGGGGGGAVAPAEPTNFRATSATATGVTLAWNAVPGATGYRLERRTGDGAYSVIQPSLTATSYTDETVAANSAYTYRVRASNAAGSSPWVEVAVTTPGEGGNGPADPAQFTATASSSTQVTLTWSEVGGATGYRLERRTGGGAYSQLATPAAGTTSYTDSTVAPATTYTYRLRARNAAGESAGVERSVTTPPATGGATFTQYGYVSLLEIGDGAQSFVMGSGSFYRWDAPQPLPADENIYAGLEDTCFVFTEGDPDPTPDPGTLPEGTPLDAGDALTVRAGANPYATMPRQTVDDDIYYVVDFMNPPASPLPGGLTLTVPGAPDGFPAFADRAFPDVPALNLTAPANPGAITRDTAFAWSGGSVTTAVVLMGQGQTANDETVSFFCIARDDGSFSFPAATRAELDSQGFTTGALTTAGRQGSSRYRSGDAVLYLSVTRSLSFEND